MSEEKTPYDPSTFDGEAGPENAPEDNTAKGRPELETQDPAPETTEQDQQTVIAAINEAWIGYASNDGKEFGLIITFRRAGQLIGQTRETTPACHIVPDEEDSWDEDARDLQFANIMRRANDVLRQAGRAKLQELAGLPVAITTRASDGQIVGWRILTEAM